MKPAHEGRDPTERMNQKEALSSRKLVVSSWTHFDGEPREPNPIERPTRQVKRALRLEGFTQDVRVGAFFWRTVVEHAAFPMGSLLFRLAEGAGFWMAPAVPNAPAVPVAKPRRSQRGSGT